jgi:hypothetical protein
MFRSTHYQGVHSCLKPSSNSSITPGCVELSQVHQCMIIQMYMCTVIGAACRFERVHGTRIHSNLRQWTHSNLPSAPSTTNIPISIPIHWQTCGHSIYWGWEKGWTIVLYSFALRDDGPARPDTCRNLRIKTYCNSTEVFALIGHIVTIKKINCCFYSVNVLWLNAGIYWCKQHMIHHWLTGEPTNIYYIKTPHVKVSILHFI